MIVAMDVYRGLAADCRQALEDVPEAGARQLVLGVGGRRVVVLTRDPLGHRPDRPVTSEEERAVYATHRTLVTLALVGDRLLVDVLGELAGGGVPALVSDGWIPLSFDVVEDLVAAACGRVLLDRTPVRFEEGPHEDCPACAGTSFAFPVDVAESLDDFCEEHADEALTISRERFETAAASNPDGWLALTEAVERAGADWLWPAYDEGDGPYEDDGPYDEEEDDGPYDDEPYDREELVVASTRILAGTGPLTAADLVAQLAPTGVLGGVLPHEREDVLRDVFGWYDALVDLPDDRYADAATVVSGMTLTHFVTDEEAAADAIPIEPDLDPLLALHLHSGFLTAGGDDIGIGVDDDAGRDGVLLQGPNGWLSGLGGSHVAFRIASCQPTSGLVVGDQPPAVLEVVPVDVPVSDLRASAALRAAFEAAEDDYVTCVEFVLAAMVLEPGLFKEPSPPLSTLLGDAGLEQRRDWVGPADTDWDPNPSRDDNLTDLVARAYRLDDCCVDSFRGVLGAFALHKDARLPSDAAADVAALLGHGDVVGAFVARALDDDTVDDVEAFALLLAAPGRSAGQGGAPARVRKRGQAAAQFVLAMCADRRGDGLAAERHVTEALDVDASFEPALLEAASFANVRGDYERALAYFGRAGVAGDEVERLSELLTPSRDAVGRNERCPCGSGRKYKACCAGRIGLPLAARAGALYDKAAAHAQRAGRRRILYDLAEVLVGEDPEESISTALNEPIVTEVALFEEGRLQTFVDERGPLLPADELDLVRSWLDARRGVWEVTEAEPGVRLELLDIRTGSRATIRGRQAAATIATGDLEWARVLSDGAGCHRFVGATIGVPLRLRESLVALMDEVPDGFEMLAWLRSATAPPELRTTEGEPIVMCRSVFLVEDADGARAVLGKVLRDDGDGGFVDETGEDSWVRGTIRVDGSTLVVEASSQLRVERLHQTVRAAVPDAVLVEDERLPFVPGSGMPAPPSDELPPEVVAAVEEKVLDYERRWVEEPVPALGGLTPREALADPTRRGDLEALLHEFDAMRPRPPALGTDARRLRVLLGLPED